MATGTAEEKEKLPPNVVKLGTGKYRAHFQRPGGKRKWFRAPTKEAAAAWVVREKYAAQQGEAAVERSTKRVGAWLEEWLGLVAQSRKRGSPEQRSPTTIEGYERQVRRYLADLHPIRLRDLQPEHIERLYAALRAGRVEAPDAGHIQLSGQTLIHLHTTLKAALKVAVSRRLIASNPAAAVEPPGIARAEKFSASTLTVEQVARLIHLAGKEPNGTFVVLAACTGLRRGELLGLHWADIHLDGANSAAPWISVKYNSQRVRGEGLVDLTPKSSSSTRDLRIPQVAAAALREHRAWQRTNCLDSGRDRVFESPRERGHSMDATYAYRRIWEPLRRAAKLGKQVRLHDLRHTLATHEHIANRVPAGVLAAYLGHSKVSFTLKTYVHPRAEDTAPLADLLDEIVAGQAASASK